MLLEVYIHQINFASVHHFDLSSVEGGKRLSKSDGDDTKSEQYKKDNQTLLLQVCIENLFKSRLRLVVACVHLCIM